MTKTINSLTVATSAASGDFVPIWRAANADTRKITKANLVGAILTGGGTIATGGYTLTLPASGTAALKTGSGVAGKMATWSDGNTIAEGGHYATDIYHKTDIYLVDKNFMSNAAVKRYNTIGAAMSAAAAGSTIFVGPGVYTEDVTFTQNNLTLRGAGPAYFDGTNLIGGTIIKGRISCDGKVGAAIKELGVDIRTTGQVDAIISGSVVSGNTYHEFENLIVIGKGSGVSGDRGHGILCTSGGGNTVRNCKFYNWYHGVALRCSDSIVSDCYFWACTSNSVVIKGDSGSGNALRCVVTNCVIDGDPASGFSRGGPIRIQNLNAGTQTRYHSVSNISANNCGEGAILIQQLAGLCANIMVSNVVSYNNGDAAIRADFDVDAATDIHFTNCMSASRSNGYGFRTTGSRTRAINCSSDATGAGRSTGLFDYLDLGSGLGTDYARIHNITFDQQQSPVAMRDSVIVNGQVTTNNGVATDAITCLWTGNGNTTSLAIDLLINYQSGSLARLIHYQISIVRPNSTTLVAAIQQIGSTLNTAGSGNNMTVAVDVATANTAKITFTGVTGIGTAAYTARITSLTTSSWTITAA